MTQIEVRLDVGTTQEEVIKIEINSIDGMLISQELTAEEAVEFSGQLADAAEKLLDKSELP